MSNMDEFFEHHDINAIKEVYVSKDEDILVFPLRDNEIACISLASLMSKVSQEYTAVEWHDLRFDSIAETTKEEQ